MSDLERAIPFLKDIKLDQYDYVIDTEAMTPEESADFIYQKLFT